MQLGSDACTCLNNHAGLSFIAGRRLRELLVQLEKKGFRGYGYHERAAALEGSKDSLQSEENMPQKARNMRRPLAKNKKHDDEAASVATLAQKTITLDSPLHFVPPPAEWFHMQIAWGHLTVFRALSALTLSFYMRLRVASKMRFLWTRAFPWRLTILHCLLVL